MIPVSDALRARTRPYVNLSIIAANILVFLYELTLNQFQLQEFFFTYGVVPSDLSAWLSSPSLTDLDPPRSVFTSMFVHGGWLHIISNMLFLWIFGDNVEDAMGHVRYLAFYLVTGVAAALAQTAVNPDAQIPSVGASGAIAGVMGAYLVLYPFSSVAVLLPFFFLFWLAWIPAAVLILAWFALQLFSGVAELGQTAQTAQAGVAFWAHIGGFVAGLVLVWFFRSKRRSRRTREGAW
ncbi:MAG TPA: rhomboid family intramembrane serine protease [Dehalococcoidia bacterium]